MYMFLSLGLNGTSESGALPQISSTSREEIPAQSLVPRSASDTISNTATCAFNASPFSRAPSQSRFSRNSPEPPPKPVSAVDAGSISADEFHRGPSHLHATLPGSPQNPDLEHEFLHRGPPLTPAHAVTLESLLLSRPHHPPASDMQCSPSVVSRRFSRQLRQSLPHIDSSTARTSAWAIPQDHPHGPASHSHEFAQGTTSDVPAVPRQASSSTASQDSVSRTGSYGMPPSTSACAQHSRPIRTLFTRTRSRSRVYPTTPSSSQPTHTPPSPMDTSLPLPTTSDLGLPTITADEENSPGQQQPAAVEKVPSWRSPASGSRRTPSPKSHILETALVARQDAQADVTQGLGVKEQNEMLEVLGHLVPAISAPSITPRTLATADLLSAAGVLHPSDLLPEGACSPEEEADAGTEGTEVLGMHPTSPKRVGLRPCEPRRSHVGKGCSADCQGACMLCQRTPAATNVARALVEEVDRKGLQPSLYTADRPPTPHPRPGKRKGSSSKRKQQYAADAGTSTHGEGKPRQAGGGGRKVNSSDGMLDSLQTRDSPVASAHAPRSASSRRSNVNAHAVVGTSAALSWLFSCLPGDQHTSDPPFSSLDATEPSRSPANSGPSLWVRLRARAASAKGLPPYARSMYHLHSHASSSQSTQESSPGDSRSASLRWTGVESGGPGRPRTKLMPARLSSEQHDGHGAGHGTGHDDDDEDEDEEEEEEQEKQGGGRSHTRVLPYCSYGGEEQAAVDSCVVHT
eukprot:CAMPEP_0202890886 /NCGR_PEP_ID=MMETSP1392-20130828/1144_1 /ASSEMBLY_ACC=CAM_ASM_000868 /TAXON_ID=225041 /ORGANISM="Chlamydomonas chlamydogama, Strain SAG 11-48b" /LENGTH=744 /DNA_ID=CAMNT_0049574537 /DNA_START=158 /DNA_END=2391 /DNA_ORIENTATION=-